MGLSSRLFSIDVLDKIICAIRAAPRAAPYTSIGTYPAAEMVRLVTELSRETGVPVPDLLSAFGRHLTKDVRTRYNAFFAQAGSTLALLQRVEGLITWRFATLSRRRAADLRDRADRRRRGHGLPLVATQADLAEGFDARHGRYFGRTIAIERADLSQGRGEVVRFVIHKARSARER